MNQNKLLVRLSILGENVSCDDNDGYMQPVDRNGYLKPVDVMHNNEQHYQTATTSSAYQVRRNESFNQTLNSANQAINVDVDYEPLGNKNTNQSCTSGSAVYCGLSDAEK
jgi:hypothetical protein